MGWHAIKINQLNTNKFCEIPPTAQIFIPNSNNQFNSKRIFFCLIDQWTVEELSGVLQIPATALRRKIAYWQSQGLLKEEATDTFILVEEQRANSDDIMLADEEETESAMASMRAQMDEQMQVIKAGNIFHLLRIRKIYSSTFC